MTEKKYALGMGDTEYLSDGTFDTVNQAHVEAKKLQRIHHDNGDFHEMYIIGEIVPSIDLAVAHIDSLADDIIESVRENLAELETFGDMDGDWIEISDAGKEKLALALKDIFTNDTKYPNAEAVGKSDEYNFKEQSQFNNVTCPHCHTEKRVRLSDNQKNGVSTHGKTNCKKCGETFVCL